MNNTNNGSITEQMISNAVTIRIITGEGERIYRHEERKGR